MFDIQLAVISMTTTLFVALPGIIIVALMMKLLIRIVFGKKKS